MATSHGPLFDLRLTTPRLTLATPSDVDLLTLADLAANGVHDPTMQPFTSAWTDLPTGGERERGLLQYYWSCRASWQPTAWKHSFGVFLDGNIIGVQDVVANNFAITRVVQTGSWLGLDYQGRGLGKEMRAAILFFAFEILGAQWVETGAYEDNEPSLGVTRALGYLANGFKFNVIREQRRKLLQLILDRQTWFAGTTDRVAVTVEGFEPCREMFGLPSE